MKQDPEEQIPEYEEIFRLEHYSFLSHMVVSVKPRKYILIRDDDESSSDEEEDEWGGKRRRMDEESLIRRR